MFTTRIRDDDTIDARMEDYLGSRLKLKEICNHIFQLYTFEELEAPCRTHNLRTLAGSSVPTVLTSAFAVRLYFGHHHYFKLSFT